MKKKKINRSTRYDSFNSSRIWIISVSFPPRSTTLYPPPGFISSLLLLRAMKEKRSVSKSRRRSKNIRCEFSLAREGRRKGGETSIKEVRSTEVKITLVAFVSPAIFLVAWGGVGGGRRTAGRGGGKRGERQTGQPLIAAIKSIEQDWHVACLQSFPLFKHIWTRTGTADSATEIRSSSRNGIRTRIVRNRAEGG